MANDWKPNSDPQTRFLEEGAFEILYGGAAGGGKSDALIIAALQDIWHPKYHGLILRRTFPQLQEIIDRTWQWYPHTGGEYRSTKHRWEWPNGAKITLGHMQHENDKHNYQGKELHFIGLDELTQFTETQYLYLISRVRRSDKELGLVFRSTTNPGGIGHVWVKRRFIDAMPAGETYIDPESGISRLFIPAKVYDNPAIMDNDPEYVRRLEALPEIEKQRLLHGEWDAFEGQVFTELSQKVHGCEPFEIPPEWEKIMVFDWGYARPFCALWFAVDFNGVIYLYREYYGMRGDDPNKGMRWDNTKIARSILDKEKEKIRFRVADPACWSPTKIKGSNQVHGPSFVEDAGKEGLFFLKADNDRIRGKQQVHQRFALETETDDSGEVVEEYPRFVAFNNCKRWWEEMQNLRESPKNPEDVDTDIPDEGYDCLHGDTEVLTKDGVFKIKDLEGKTGYVKTIFGLWTKFSDCKLYKKNSEVVKVYFDDGKSAICTSDHMFLTDKLEWVAAKDLTDCVRYVNISETINKGDEKCNQKLSARQFKSLVGKSIFYVENTFSQRGYLFTEKCGNSIRVKYRMVLLSTIKTITQAIIILKILRCFLLSNITHTIQEIQTTPIGLRQCMKVLKNGTVVPQVKRGIKNIMKKIVLPKCIKDIQKNVFFAVRSLKVFFMQSFVQTTVNQHGEGSTVLMMYQQYAKRAVRNSWRTNIKIKKPVAKNAGGRCVKVEPAGVEDTYCLTAKHTNSFQINNGLMVANCTRYAFMARPIIPKRKHREPTGTFQSERKRMIRAKKYAVRHGVSLAAAYARIR